MYVRNFPLCRVSVFEVDFIETAHACEVNASTGTYREYLHVNSQSRPCCIDFAPSILPKERERERGEGGRQGKEKESIIDISVYERGNISSLRGLL